jgi:hypothetical protein
MNATAEILVAQPLASPAPSTVSKRSLVTGRILSGVAVAFLLFDATMKVIRLPVVIETSARYGFDAGAVFGIGVLLLACVLVYLVPRTAVLGAILLTGYLGGAVVTHVRASEGLFPILFPVFFGALVWGGLFLRDARLRALVPARRLPTTEARG